MAGEAVAGEGMERPGDVVPYIDRTRKLYATQKPYRWVHHDPEREPPPFSPIEKPLSEMRVALIGSAGVYCADQEPFHFRNDCSQREIPADSDASQLRVAHFGYDVSAARRDPACVFPVRALRELASDGVVGALVDPALSFMGGIYSARRVREQVAPRFRDFVLRQQADLAFLVPV